MLKGIFVERKKFMDELIDEKKLPQISQINADIFRICYLR
jgi:hypothetical protein